MQMYQYEKILKAIDIYLKLQNILFQFTNIDIYINIYIYVCVQICLLNKTNIYIYGNENFEKKQKKYFNI